MRPMPGMVGLVSSGSKVMLEFFGGFRVEMLLLAKVVELSVKNLRGFGPVSSRIVYECSNGF